MNQQLEQSTPAYPLSFSDENELMDKKEQYKEAQMIQRYLNDRVEWIKTEQRRLEKYKRLTEPIRHMIEYYEDERPRIYNEWLESWKEYNKIGCEIRDRELVINLLKCN
jgi:hypothetical protein